MRKSTITIIILVFMAGLIFHQQAKAQFLMPQNTFGAGGGQTTGSGYNIVGTVGQQAIGTVSNSTNINMIGFWYQSGGRITQVEQIATALPTVFRLEQNYPNPFNPTTTIRFSIPQPEHVVLRIFDALGRETAVLVNEKCAAGEYSIRFEANGLASGVYIYSLQAGKLNQTKKLILLK